MVRHELIALIRASTIRHVIDSVNASVINPFIITVGTPARKPENVRVPEGRVFIFQDQSDRADRIEIARLGSGTIGTEYGVSRNGNVEYRTR